MRRYRGEVLKPGSRIAVIANDAIGNFVVVTPLLQMLRDRHPGCQITYVGGKRTAELQNSSDLFDETHALLGQSPGELSRFLADHAGSFDLAINVEQTAYSRVLAGTLGQQVCGPSIGVGGRGDLPFEDNLRGQLWKNKQWIAPTLPNEFPFLSSGFIGEIFCRLAYCEGAVPRYRLPSAACGDPPDVLVAVSASLGEKLWPAENWIAAAQYLISRGLSVGLLGAPPAIGKTFWYGSDAEEGLCASGVQDLRGTLTLPQVVNALSRAKLVLTLDNGILHLAASTDTPTVGLFRHGIHRLWAPPVETLTVLTPGEGRLVADISVEAVTEAISSAL